MSKTYQGLAALFLVCSLAFSQGGNGEISGTVTDASGAIVSGATVTITNPATGFTRTLKSNESGLYNAPALNPGLYTVRTEMQGFQAQSRSNVELQVGQTATINFALAVGNDGVVLRSTDAAIFAADSRAASAERPARERTSPATTAKWSRSRSRP